MINNETFGFKLLKSCLSIFSAIITLLAFIVAFIFWRYKSDSTITMFYFVIICSIFAFIVLTLLRFSIQLYDENINNTVKVIQYIEPYKPYKDCEAILLATNSNSFALDGIISLYQEKK